VTEIGEPLFGQEEKMIELKRDGLHFYFPEVHEDARLEIHFQRTLRIPDDGRTYPLPPGLEHFPLRHVDDYASEVPEEWVRHGGVFLPMYQSEALWINFVGDYPFAVKVATGKIDAVTGKEWSLGLHKRPQDYLLIPEQPWLDGYCVEEGVIRQFVAMPLGSGYTAEEQITGEAEHGGIQIVAYPLRAEYYRPPPRLAEAMYSLADALPAATPSMGLAPGGKMRQEIYQDRKGLTRWDTDHGSRCFVHITNSLAWRHITGEDPPKTPITAKEYAKWGMPWFDCYGGDKEVLKGGSPLKGLKSVSQMGAEKKESPLPENVTVDPGNVITLGPKVTRDQVREGEF
jgi:hypothetical protein